MRLNQTTIFQISHISMGSVMAMMVIHYSTTDSVALLLQSARILFPSHSNGYPLPCCLVWLAILYMNLTIRTQCPYLPMRMMQSKDDVARLSNVTWRPYTEQSPGESNS